MQRIGLRPGEKSPQGEWGLPPFMEALLLSRGVRTAEEAQAFLHPGREQLLPPLSLPGIAQAAEILRAARAAGKRVAVYGDYDVDGVCATALLTDALERLGLEAVPYIPDRHREGYGLNVPAVLALARDHQVLVTVDCGITSIQETEAAQAAGMQVIITDHHQPGAALPPADALVSPLLGGYPFPFLCGAGVAWKLAMALLGEEGFRYIDLAALATVADMVSLRGENRAIAALGLPLLARTERPGLRALLRLAGVGDTVSSEQAGFQLAPRINACGRMESARTALELLRTRSMARGEELALKMDALNQERKKQEARVIAEAELQAGTVDFAETSALVVAGEDWNSGVVGLAAGRIAEEYACPTVALARDGENYVGSARSAGDVDIHAALSQCADLFSRFGGHKQAAGLTMAAERLPELRRRLSQAVRAQTGGNPLVNRVLCDGELPLSAVTPETVRMLSQLQPCGMDNPAPCFLCQGVEALSLRAVGAEGRHLKAALSQDGALRDGIFFGGGAWAGAPGGGRLRLAMTPVLNEFRGRISAECMIRAMELQPETLEPDEAREALSLLADPRGEEAARPLAWEALEDFAPGALLLCRCQETALSLAARYPEAEFCLEKTADSRGQTEILLYGTAAGTCARFRHVILCDGDTGEAAAYRRACPGAEVYALPPSAALSRLLKAAYLGREQLRNCYRNLRAGLPRDLEDFAEAGGLSTAQAAFALTVLSQIQLIDYCPAPFSARLLPMKKGGPEGSGLFRAAARAWEEKDGIFGL